MNEQRDFETWYYGLRELAANKLGWLYVLALMRCDQKEDYRELFDRGLTIEQALQEHIEDTGPNREKLSML